MTDDALFAGHYPHARQPKPGQRMVSMTKGGEEARSDLRDQSEAGAELQLFRGDDFVNRRLYASRETAREASCGPGCPCG
jgi:hypothetical protein